MNIIYEFSKQHITELHQLFQLEWWTKGRSLAETQAIIEETPICIGLVDDAGSLKGFVRVLTDFVIKAFIFDAIVVEDLRGGGFGRVLMQAVINHPQLANVRHFELYCLPEMVPFYEKYGFSTQVGGIYLMRHIAR